jgi:phosphoglycolate phosphatase-like HAD superfamily hydrolase
MQGLVLDFDGVLFDSAPEAFLVARRTYAEVGPPIPAEESLPAPGEPWEVPREGVLADSLYQRFVHLMALGNRAEDYAAILSTLERGVKVDDQEDYNRERERLPEEYAEEFHAHFYEVRTRFQERQPGRWRSLQGPYTPFIELLHRRAADRTLAIATAKDRGSVRRLLDDNGLSDLFPEERLMDKETGRSKSAHLTRLSETLGIPFADLTFVDDKVNHLDAVAGLGVRCVLAAWGYNGPREHQLARRRGYAVCGLEDAEAVLFEGEEP